MPRYQEELNAGHSQERGDGETRPSHRRHSSDALVEIFSELFPRKKRPDVSGPKAKAVTEELARHVRAGLEPEEITDLWSVVFPADRHVYYDEETEVVRYNEEEPWYAEQ